MLLLVLLVYDGCDMLLRVVAGCGRSLSIVGCNAAVGCCCGLWRLVAAVVCWSSLLVFVGVCVAAFGALLVVVVAFVVDVG